MPVVPAPAQQREHKCGVLAYLRSAPVVGAARTVPCRFASCAFEPLDARVHADGEWRWPATMAHYVDVHGLALPDEMFARMLAAGFVAPARSDGGADDGGAAWNAFAIAHEAKPRPGAQEAKSLAWQQHELQQLLNKGRRPVGYWATSATSTLSWLPHPSTLVDEHWELADRPRIVAYLKAGVQALAWDGCSTCRFPGCESGGSDDVTDGLFVWPADLWHYVELHHVKMPAPFIAHMRAHDFMVPDGPRWSLS